MGGFLNERAIFFYTTDVNWVFLPLTAVYHYCYYNSIHENIRVARNVMGHTITGAASGETASSGAEGFTISGKRTEENVYMMGVRFSIV